MVNVSNFVTQKYLAAKNAMEYKGKTFVIESAFPENISGSDKLCIRLKGIDKPLVLNQTNLTLISSKYGDDTDAWINHKVTLMIVKVNYNGQMVDGIQLEV